MSSRQPTHARIQKRLARGGATRLARSGRRSCRELADKQRGWAAHNTPRGESNFKGVKLTGADVFWLATYALTGPDVTADTRAAAQLRLRTPSLSDPATVWPAVSNLHLESASLVGAHLEGAALAEAHLEG